MGNDNYVVFEVIGIKHKNSAVFEFYEDAEYEMNNDKYIQKIVVTADISQVTFYLKNSLQNSDNENETFNYLVNYLSGLMISLLKNSSSYSNVLLQPIIRRKPCLFLENNDDNDENIQINDHIQIQDSLVYKIRLDGSDILRKWIQDINVSNYVKKQDKYDILFLLLQGRNSVQKYMAIYAYLMGLVCTIYQKQRERQSDVVKYISENCFRVGVTLRRHISSRTKVKSDDPDVIEDQFTFLRNKIAHPSRTNDKIIVMEKDVNELSSIVCCAIEELPLES